MGTISALIDCRMCGSSFELVRTLISQDCLASIEIVKIYGRRTKDKIIQLGDLNPIVFHLSVSQFLNIGQPILVADAVL